VHGADEIGSKDERALQDRYHKQVVIVAPGDLLGELEIATGDRRRRKQDLDILAAHNWHHLPFQRNRPGRVEIQVRPSLK